MEIKVRPNSKLNQPVRSAALGWEPLAGPGVSGVHVKVLRFDEATGRAPTILLKFEPGATYPSHVHPGGKRSSSSKATSASARTSSSPGTTCTPRPTTS